MTQRHRMGVPMISRRKFTQLAGTSLTVGVRNGLERVALATPTSIRVAAVQMTAELANVEANLLQAERLTRVAFERGARWVILPEFFTSAIAFHPRMANATRAINRPPAQLLRKLAREGTPASAGRFSRGVMTTPTTASFWPCPTGPLVGTIRTTPHTGKPVTTSEAGIPA